MSADTRFEKRWYIQLRLSAYCTTDGIQVKIWADDWVLFATVSQLSAGLNNKLTSVCSPSICCGSACSDG